MHVRKLTAALAAVPLLLASGIGVATADDISNNLDTTIDAVAEVMPLNVGGPNGTTQLYVTPRNGDGKSGCNLTGDTALTLSVLSSASAVATISPSTVTFNACSDTHTLTVTPVAQGSATVSVTQMSNTTGAAFNLAPATFTVNVAAPANTAPTVVVAGVTGGASYSKGAVPTATCQVNDAEDGAKTFAATPSAVTGPYASDGIGSQTASCSYTDAGGLTAGASETYSIVDPTAPVITYATTPSAPGGANGWYKGDVSVAWNVTDPESSISSRTGCVDQNITRDQAEETYECSATSAGGSTGPVQVKIKRDGTDPTGVAVTGINNGAEFYPHETLPTGSCASATDALSGLASSTATPIRTGPVNGVYTYTCSATDNAGNTASDAVTVTVKQYGFTGLLQPVDQSGVFNRAKAGSAIPVKFRLSSGVTSTAILDGDPTVKSIACPNTATFDLIEETVSTNTSGLQFSDGVHNYVWKSPTTYAGKCFELTVTLKGGEKQTAKFHFTK